MSKQVEMIGPSSIKQSMMLQASANLAVLGGAMGCFDSDTEYLSDRGWVRIADYDGGLVGQYDPENDQISFVKPDDYIKIPCDNLKRLQARGLDFCLSPEHRVLYWNTGYSEYKVISWEEALDRHSKSKTKGWTGKIKTCFNTSGNGIDMSEGEIRLQVAVQADGRIVKGGLNNYTQMRFSKKRKYDRLIDLCTKFNLDFKDNGCKPCPRYSSGLEYEVIVWPKRSDKVFSGDWWECSQQQVEWIADEVRYWDSSMVENQSNTTVRYSTAIKENADFIQYCFHCNGMNSSVNYRLRNGSEEYTVQSSTSGKGFRSFANKDGKALIQNYKTLDGYKYCFSVPSSFLVVRRSNKIFLSGNSGKSFISLLYPLKYAHDPWFRGIIFRKTTGEITAQGGLWENACEIYIKVFGRENIKIHQQQMKITFPSGGSVKFSFLESSKDLLKHQGAQYTFVCFDEATHFTQDTIEYLLKRMRSARATHTKQMILTCNPDPDWFALDWIKPYLLPDGTPDLTKDGKIRYYIIDNNEYIWADTKEELEERYGGGDASGIMSFTFISANCTDNIPLMKADPSYLSRLKAQPYVDMQRNLLGNWLVRPTGSTYIRREWFIEQVTEPAHTDILKTVRAYDFAGTLRTDAYPSPDYTACIKMSKLKSGDYFVHEVQRTRIQFGEWREFILKNAYQDGKGVDIVLPIDPNPASKAATLMLSKEISEFGFYVRTMKASSKKLDRFRPFASMVMNGGVQILKDSGYDFENNHDATLSFFYRELEGFDGIRRNTEAGHDDMVDACSDAFMALAQSVTIPNIGFGLKSANLSRTTPFG
tara:strand:+ start:19863 stop:22316 length:2454 start_codon:yes stop_codon:yes gene_type:complete